MLQLPVMTHDVLRIVANSLSLHLTDQPTGAHRVTSKSLVTAYSGSSTYQTMNQQPVGKTIPSVQTEILRVHPLKLTVCTGFGYNKALPKVSVYKSLDPVQRNTTNLR